MRFYNNSKTFLTRLKHDDDLILAIKHAFQSGGIKMGVFMAIGAVKKAKTAFYDQQEHIYREESIDEPAEILSCTGNVSEVDGEAFVHAHITLSLKDGSTKGGHLVEGTPIFACELYGVALEGEQLKRRFDDVTGLKLWNY
jgi:predicted DNA-binding protein with PD1-like motif